MSQRLDALKSKLPHGVLSIIREYDSHPVADIVRQVKFEHLPGHTYAASGLRLKNCNVWEPIARELKRRIKHNRSLWSLTQGVWMPVYCYDVQTWILSFPRWKFETLEDLEYLPQWVKSEYKMGVR
jgi:hypothetical protein